MTEQVAETREWEEADEVVVLAAFQRASNKAFDRGWSSPVGTGDRWMAELVKCEGNRQAFWTAVARMTAEVETLVATREAEERNA